MIQQINLTFPLIHIGLMKLNMLGYGSTSQREKSMICLWIQVVKL